jgi:cation transport regulator ChaB
VPKADRNESRKTEIASPVTATATKVSSAAKKQEEHNDNQKKFHDKAP